MKTNTASLITPFALEFDMSTEGHESIWDAHAGVVKESHIHPTLDVVSVAVGGDAPSGWPTLSIVFASLDAAKAYTYIYLGLSINDADVHTDDEVNEYVSFGKFVN